MPNLLDLKPKQKPTIIERVVFKKRAWWVEVIKTLVVIFVVASIVYGVSKAENGSVQSAPTQSLTGIYGVVISMSGDSLVLDDSQGSKYPGVDIFNVDLRHVKTVETNDDTPLQLTLTDIVAGDKIITRGIIDGNNLDAQGVISFSYVKLLATTTIATSSDKVATTTEATTTDKVATTEATSTPDVTATSTTLGDFSTATSTATSTDSSATITPVATSTDALVTTTSTSTEATTTDQTTN